MLWKRWSGFDWERLWRTVFAVGTAMVLSHAVGVAPGAAALGAFDALLVDNGGPYRLRLVTMATTVAGGSVAFIIGALVPQPLVTAVLITLLVCFATIFARVLSQPLASSGVLILVLYFAGLGSAVHTFQAAALAAQLVLLGGAWAILLSLLLWPLDPFRPARLSVAECYRAMSEYVSGLPEGDEARAFEWQRIQRTRMETARNALAATAARAPSRTIRARNLTVLLETSDLLLARTMRLTELAALAPGGTQAAARLASVAAWLSGAEDAVYAGLAARPADGGSAFCGEGSLRLQSISRRRDELAAMPPAAAGSLLAFVLREEREALLELEIVFDAVSAIWTGIEVRRVPWMTRARNVRQSWDRGWIDAALRGADAAWRDAVAANWTMQSAMLRHALRMAIVGAVDVVVMRLIHVNHGFWLPMTSLLLLQPYSAGTARKSVQRVSGTVAGGLLAAVLAAGLPNQLAMIPVITLLCAMAVATFAMDYTVYCFFLTPTFVLMSLPHPHDWRYASIRMGTTLLGAAIALAAMRLLWPERAEVELGALLRRGAAADAAYLRALARFWGAAEEQRVRAEREVLAVARRACGLASNDAEEAVDRVMQEPQFGRLSESELQLRQTALAFTTYLRRLTQSVTTLAVVGRPTEDAGIRLERAARHMEGIATGHPAEAQEVGTAAVGDVAQEQLERVERQVGILQRAAEGLR
jgi:uncharacterized membrane protein YccC